MFDRQTLLFVYVYSVETFFIANFRTQKVTWKLALYARQRASGLLVPQYVSRSPGRLYHRSIPPAWTPYCHCILRIRRKKNTCLLQHKTYFPYPNTESPDSCSVSKTATLPRFLDLRTFYFKWECRTAVRLRTSVALCSVKETISKMFSVSFWTFCISVSATLW